MIKHILKIFIRDLFRNKTYSIINLISLSIAFACSFLIVLFVIHEITYDGFLQNKENIYRINAGSEWTPGKSEFLASTSIIMAEHLKQDYPEIDYTTRIYDAENWGDGQYAIQNENSVREEKFKLVDNDFFKIFSFKIVNGKKEDHFLFKNSLLISERSAKKYFGDKNPIGQDIKVKNNEEEIDYHVVAVFENIPSNSTFQAEFIGSIDLIEHKYRNRNWILSNVRTFVQLNENTSQEEFENKLINFSKKYTPEEEYIYEVQNIKDIYMNSDHLNWYDLPKGNKRNIYLFSVIAILILVVASINYVIISTARGVSRSTEIGMRKVVGAKRRSIIRQIQFESLLFIILIFPIALMISELMLPIINRLLDKQMEIHYFENYPYLIGLVVITFLIGVLSGGYISLFLSKFQPEDILKRKFTSKYGSNLLRKGLIVFQIAIIVALFIFTGIIYLQTNYIQNKDLGYNTNDVVLVYPPHNHDIRSYETYVNSIKNNPIIKYTAEVEAGFFSSMFNFWDFRNIADPDNLIECRVLSGDHNFIDVFGFELLEGRKFDMTFSDDKNAVILNETAAKQIGIENQIGSYIMTNRDRQFKVVGIIKDFNMGSLHEKIPPVAIFLKQGFMVTQIAVKMNKNKNTSDVIKYLESQWYEFGTGGRVDFEFLENKLNNQYNADKKFGETIKFFTILTMIIAFLGLFGFSLYMSKQRNKEMGIRKTFGANVKDILVLFSKEYLTLTIFANLLAWPIAYWLTKSWLSNYSFRIDYPLYTYVIVIIISILFISLIVSINTIRTANQNPSDILRYE